MPAALSYPGVYIQEIDSGVHTISGVATSITAFVGRALRGPVNVPTTVNSYGEFERIFGGRWIDSYLAYAVRDFFQNGGGEAVIVRLFKPDFEQDSDQDAAELEAKAAAQKAATDAHTAATGGADAAHVIAAAVAAKAAFKKPHEKEAVDLVVAAAQKAADDGGNPAAVDAAATAAVTVAWHKASPPVFAKFKMPLTGGGDWWLEAAYPGSWGKALQVRIDDDVSVSNKTKLFNLTVRDGPTGAVEIFRNLSRIATDARRVDRVLASQSKLLRAPTLPGALPKVQPIYPGYDPWGDPPPQKQPADPDPDPSNIKVSEGGEDGEALNRDSFTGDGLEGAKKGLFALEKADLFNLLYIPPHEKGGSIEDGLVDDAVKYCEKRRAMMLIDPLPAWDDPSLDVAKVLTDVESGKVGAPARNAALFFPRLVQSDPEQDGREENFPPGGAIAGVFARTDAVRGVWKAPAGLDAVLSNAPKLSASLTDGENGRLNMRGINCLRAMPGAGRVVWGARTRKGDDRTPDDYKYVPVRRMALFIEESLFRGTHWVVFEPNDEPLWASIRLNVGAFMQRLFRKGAFQGSSPRDAYFVKCDKDTTTQDDINQGIVNIIVGFAPLKPAEFVVITLQQMAGKIET